jgi:hypothetical protein
MGLTVPRRSVSPPERRSGSPRKNGFWRRVGGMDSRAHRKAELNKKHWSAPLAREVLADLTALPSAERMLAPTATALAVRRCIPHCGGQRHDNGH